MPVHLPLAWDGRLSGITVPLFRACTTGPASWEKAPMLQIIERFDTLSRVLGRVLAIIYLLMTLNVFFDVVMRYFF